MAAYSHRYTLLLVLSLFFASACQKVKFQQPTFQTIEGINLQSITSTGVELKAMAVFNNPNAMGLTLTYTDLNIMVEGKQLAKIVQAQSIKVPAKSDFSVPVDVRVTPKQLWGDGFSALIGKKDLTVRYQGYVTVGAIGIKVNVPIDYQDKLSINLMDQLGF